MVLNVEDYYNVYSYGHSWLIVALLRFIGEYHYMIFYTALLFACFILSDLEISAMQLEKYFY